MTRCVTVADSYEPMTGCHDASIHRVAMQGVAVSVGSGIATSTHYGRGETMRASEAQRLVEGTTLGTVDGARWCSLVIHSVKCAETQWRR